MLYNIGKINTSVCSSMHPSVCPSAIRLSVQPSVSHPSVRQPSVCLSIHPSVHRPSVCTSIHPSVCQPSIYLSIHPSVHQPSVCPSIHPSIHQPSICLSNCYGFFLLSVQKVTLVYYHCGSLNANYLSVMCVTVPVGSVDSSSCNVVFLYR